jgi:hypothetical protein
MIRHSKYSLKQLPRVGLKEWLKGWKPIPLCWWFEKHDLPIPKYIEIHQALLLMKIRMLQVGLLVLILLLLCQLLRPLARR